MNWFIIWTIIYLAAILIITLRHVKVKNFDSYMINNRKTGTLPLVFTTLATFVGGGTSMGLIAFGYESGFAAVAIGVAYVIGFFILSRYAGRIQDTGRKRNIYSFPGYLNDAYLIPKSQSTFSKLFSSVISSINIFIFFFLLAAQFVAMASLLEFTFEMGYVYAAIISCLIVIGYTAVAGLSGVIVTDFIQFIVIVILIAVVFIPGIWNETDGLQRLQELPKEMVNGTSEGILFLVAVPVLLCWSVLVRMDIWQRLLAAKSKKVAKRVTIISGLGMLPFYILFPLVGMAVKLGVDPIESKDATFVFLSTHCNEFLMGFAVIGFLAALMSSGDSFLNIISISAIKNFEGWKKAVTPEKTVFKRVRIAVIIFGLIALIMSLVFPKIVDLMVVGISTIAIFVPATLLALTGKDVKRHRITAFASIVAGFVVNFAFFVFGVVAPEKFAAKSSFIPAVIIGVIVLFIGILIDNVKRNKQANINNIENQDIKI